MSETVQALEREAIEVFNDVYSVVMLLTPFLAYVPQYRLMRRNGATGSFSSLVSYFLLLTNVTKAAFFFGRPFSPPILLQTAVVFCLQVALLALYHTLDGQNHKTPYSGLPLRRVLFRVLSRVFAVFAFTVGLLAFCADPAVTSAVGAAAGVFEALVAVPQCVRNCRTRSVASVR